VRTRVTPAAALAAPGRRKLPRIAPAAWPSRRGLPVGAGQAAGTRPGAAWPAALGPVAGNRMSRGHAHPFRSDRPAPQRACARRKPRGDGPGAPVSAGASWQMSKRTPPGPSRYQSVTLAWHADRAARAPFTLARCGGCSHRQAATPLARREPIKPTPPASKPSPP